MAKKTTLLVASSFVITVISAAIVFLYTRADSQVSRSQSLQWELTERSRYHEKLYDPSEIWALGENQILISDAGNEKYPVYLLDLRRRDITRQVRSGQGPGEAHGKRYKRASFFSDGRILLWDAGLNRISIYDSSLVFLGLITGNVVRTFNYQVGLINDSTLFVVGATDNFLSAYRLRDRTVSDDRLLWSIRVDDDEHLIPLTNYLLKQAIYFRGDGESLYMGFEYASVLMRINEAGIVWSTLEPAQHPLPWTQPEKSGGYALPDLAEHAVGILDLAVTDQYVVVLYSGKKATKTEFLKNIHRAVEYLDNELYHSVRAFVYKKENGHYLGQLSLPVPAQRMDIKKNAMYLLTSAEMLPTIFEYRVQVADGS